MSDIEAPLRYSEPVVDRPGRGGKVGFLLVVALGIAVAAVGLALLSREAAEPLVLAFLAGLAVVGIFTLFAGATGIVHLGEKAVGSDLARAFLDNMPNGILVTDLDGAIVYANQAYQDMTEIRVEVARKLIAAQAANGALEALKDIRAAFTEMEKGSFHA